MSARIDPPANIVDIGQYVRECPIWQFGIFSDRAMTVPQNVTGFSFSFVIHRLNDPSYVYLTKTTAGVLILNNPVVPPGYNFSQPSFNWGVLVPMLEVDTDSGSTALPPLPLLGAYSYYLARTDPGFFRVTNGGVYLVLAK